MQQYIEVSPTLFDAIASAHMAGNVVYNTLYDACSLDLREVLAKMASDPQQGLVIIENNRRGWEHLPPRLVIPETREGRRLLWIF